MDKQKIAGELLKLAKELISKTKYSVVEERMLGYFDSKGHFFILSNPRGEPKSGSYPVGNRDVRPATRSDFKKFRVQVPSDFRTAREQTGAKELVADYGDVDASHSVSDYFESEHSMSPDEVRLLQGMLMEAISKTRSKREALVRKALLSNRADLKELKSLGIKVK